MLIATLGLASNAVAAPTDKDVTFTGAGGAQLAGTLTLPQNAAKAPALVLIAGSGPTDRDGNQGQAFHTDLLKQMADVLAGIGVASLRYDKRGVGASHMPAEKMMSQTALGDYAAWENFVGDAEGAYRFLQEQPVIDPKRVGFLGHSEGSWLALQAASDLKNSPHPPFLLVLVSAPGRPIDQLIHEQLVEILKVQGATVEQTKYFLDQSERITEAIRKTGVTPDGVPPGLVALYPPYIGRFFKSELAVDPAKLASAFPGAVLVLQGEKDNQVSAETDAPLLGAALKGRHPDDHEVVVVAGASHNLKMIQSDSDPGIVGPVAPQAIHALTDWLAAHLK